MPIKKPGKRPFAPWLADHRALTGEAKKHGGVADLLLTPLIDMFVILVVFLIMNFSANGELITISKDVQLPKAANTQEIERAPIIQITATVVTVEGVRVANSEELLREDDLRIQDLTDKLQEMRKVDEMMHPGQPFKGQIIINCDKDIDFKLIKKVMYACSEAGYNDFNYAVLVKGDNAAAAEGGGE